jgi:hypothetical protein
MSVPVAATLQLAAPEVVRKTISETVLCRGAKWLLLQESGRDKPWKQSRVQLKGEPCLLFERVPRAGSLTATGTLSILVLLGRI